MTAPGNPARTATQRAAERARASAVGRKGKVQPVQRGPAVEFGKQFQEG